MIYLNFQDLNKEIKDENTDEEIDEDRLNELADQRLLTMSHEGRFLFNI